MNSLGFLESDRIPMQVQAEWGSQLRLSPEEIPKKPGGALVKNRAFLSTYMPTEQHRAAMACPVILLFPALVRV